LALHRRLWRKQADLVRDLARNAPDITCGPLVAVAAGRLALAKGRPLYVSDTDHLGWQSSFDQQEALASYHARRARAVASARRDLHLWERVGAEPILAAAYDDEHLWACSTCGAVIPDAGHPEYGPLRCGACGATVVRWPEREPVPSLAESLDGIDQRERDQGCGPTAP